MHIINKGFSSLQHILSFQAVEHPLRCIINKGRRRKEEAIKELSTFKHVDIHLKISLINKKNIY